MPNSFVILSTALLCSAFAMTQALGAEPTLRQAAAGHLLIGTALMADKLNDPKIATFVAAQFDCITPENQLKPLDTEPRPGVFEFTAGDKILAFAQGHGMKLIGHNLCWHRQTPGWMFNDANGKPLGRDLALANLKRHIEGVAGHYKGKILGWDVVNEALSDVPGEYLRDTPARQAIGDDYVVQAFKFAHQADPQAELYYNEYSAEYPAKRASQLRLIRELKAAGCRLDAVGMQGHFALQNSDAPALMEQSIIAFAAEGIKVSITELDVDVLPRNTTGANTAQSEKRTAGDNPYSIGLPPEVAKRQAEFYSQVFKVVARQKNVVQRVSFWGLDDSATWLNDWPIHGRRNYPLLFDRDLKPKLAFDAVIKILSLEK